MKLMGAPKLFEAADGSARASHGACAALRIELEAGAWRSQREVAASFPLARWDNNKLVVPVDEQTNAVVAFNYKTGIALIESVARAEGGVSGLPARGKSRP
jgi:hypothetical protein